MADSTLSAVPRLTTVIPQDFIVEALGGATNPTGLLDRFPDGLYLKSPESHLLRFMYVLLGASGVGALRDNYLQARLLLEQMGFQLFDLDSFFGDPLAFGRLLDETYDTDVSSPADSAGRAVIAAQDAAYRNRAINFLGGVRLGNSPEGMRLVSKGGLGHDVEIIENYKYLYDVNSDNPVGYRRFGSTTSTEEMVIIPRQDVSQSSVQQIEVLGDPTSGQITFSFNGRFATDPDLLSVEYDAPAISSWDLTDPGNPVLLALGVQEALEALPNIGTGNVRVDGGPGGINPWIVTFQGELANQPQPEIEQTNTLAGGISPTVQVTSIQSGLNASDEVVSISPIDTFYLQQALDRIRAVTIIPTMTSGRGKRARQLPQAQYTSSEFIEVVRYVTGDANINWPSVDSNHWIVANSEREAPRPVSSASHHYQGFHDIASIVAYSDAALADADYSLDVAASAPYLSEHIGPFAPAQRSAFPALSGLTDPTGRYPSVAAPADSPEPPLMGADGLIQGIYPADYATLPGVRRPSTVEHFWSSVERTSGADFLEIDLGSVQVVNFMAFEILQKPIDIQIDFDLLDQYPRRKFAPVTALPNLVYPDSVSPSAGTWTYLEFNFGDALGNPLYTRFIRVEFDRRADANTPFLLDVRTGVLQPWSIDIRNLRLGRNVSN